MNAERRTILFAGRVQGVGFRMTTIAFARDLPLAGMVRNTSDGRVELVVEGLPKDMDFLVTRLREHFGVFIRNIEQQVAPASGLLGEGIRIVH